jgi:hypothetical protein
MPPRTETQISAFVSVETKALIEQYSRSTGVKKNHLVEEALRHHLQALRELPADVIVHPRLVLSAKSGRKVVAATLRRDRNAKPTAKLRELMLRDDD